MVLPDLKETEPSLVTEMVTVLVQEGLLGNWQSSLMDTMLDLPFLCRMDRTQHLIHYAKTDSEDLKCQNRQGQRGPRLNEFHAHKLQTLEPTDFDEPLFRAI
ncbi:hypothetical protein Tco_1218698 [Tanacetum coccineum]